LAVVDINKILNFLKDDRKSLSLLKLLQLRLNSPQKLCNRGRERGQWLHTSFSFVGFLLACLFVYF